MGRVVGLGLNFGKYLRFGIWEILKFRIWDFGFGWVVLFYVRAHHPTPITLPLEKI